KRVTSSQHRKAGSRSVPFGRAEPWQRSALPLGIRTGRVAGGQGLAGFERGLEVGDDCWPASADELQNGASGFEVVVNDGQPDLLPERLAVEGNLARPSHAILLPGKRRPCSPIRLQSDSKVTPGSAG